MAPQRCASAKAGRGPEYNLLRILFREIGSAVKGPAIFIDRDGVINCRRPGDYVLNWSQFVFVPGIREALKQLSSLGLPMIVISNQAAVGKGLLSQAGLEEITARMNEVLLADGTSLAAAYYCPHRIEDDCPCRKPKPALLLNAAGDFSIEPKVPSSLATPKQMRRPPKRQAVSPCCWRQGRRVTWTHHGGRLTLFLRLQHESLSKLL